MPAQIQTQTDLTLAALCATQILRQAAAPRPCEFGPQGLANNPLARTVQSRPRLT